MFASLVSITLIGRDVLLIQQICPFRIATMSVIVLPQRKHHVVQNDENNIHHHVAERKRSPDGRRAHRRGIPLHNSRQDINNKSSHPFSSREKDMKSTTFSRQHNNISSSNNGTNESKSSHRDMPMRRSHDNGGFRSGSHNHHSHHGNVSSHPSSSSSQRDHYSSSQQRSPFSFDITSDDEHICRHAAELALPAPLEIDMELAQCLNLTAIVHDRALYDHMDAVRKRATSVWLKSKSKEEQDLYLRKKENLPVILN